MDHRTEVIVKAGWTMFARYGYAKTTMSDIATEAGVARQTVYNAFSSKEDVLRAVVRFAGEESLSAVHAEWENDQTLEQKLAAFQRLGPESWYVAILAAPDWGELMEGMHKTAAAEMSIMEEKWVAALEAMLAAHPAEVATATLPLREIAGFFYSTSKNAKHGAKDLDDLRARLKVILAATLALLRA